MNQLTTIGLDLAKDVIAVCAIDTRTALLWNVVSSSAG